MNCELAAAAGAALVAALNELRAQVRARQADRDRREALIAAALARQARADEEGSSPGPDENRSR